MVARGHTKKIVGLLNVNSTHLNTLFGSRSWSWYDHDLLPKRVFKCIQFTFNNPTVPLV
jgi:hypothetical protein